MAEQTIELPERPAVAKKKPEPETARTLFALKGFPSWFEWLKEFADSQGIPATTLIDMALREKAAKEGFRLPPKRY